MKRIDVAAIPALYRQRGLVAQVATWRGKIEVHDGDGYVPKLCGCLLTVLFAKDEELEPHTPFNTTELFERGTEQGYEPAYLGGLLDGFDDFPSRATPTEARKLGREDGRDAFNELVKEGIAYTTGGWNATYLR